MGMLFNSCKKNLSTVFLTIATILSCMVMLWLFYAQSWDDDNITEVMVWLTLLMVPLGLVALLYVGVSYYRALFLLFGMELSDGKRSLAKFKILIWLDIVLIVFNPGWFGGESPVFDFLSIIINALIGILMYFYLRRRGRFFNKCITAYAFFGVLSLMFTWGSKKYDDESILIFSSIDCLMMMFMLIFNAVFIYYAKCFYLSVQNEEVQ